MVTTKKSTAPAKKRPSSVKKSVSRTTVKKSPVSSQKVDIYPNRMTYAVSAAAGAILVLIAVIIAYS